MSIVTISNTDVFYTVLPTGPGVAHWAAGVSQNENNESHLTSIISYGIQDVNILPLTACKQLPTYSVDIKLKSQKTHTVATMLVSFSYINNKIQNTYVRTYVCIYKALYS